MYEFEDDVKGFLQPLVEHTLKLAKLLKFSHELLKYAAADLDSLKCEQLQNQARLIRVQEDLNVKKSVQLDSVEKTVDDKLSIWSSVVAKNSDKKVMYRRRWTKL